MPSTETVYYTVPQHHTSQVTIPFGWTLVIDESPPLLSALVIQGDVAFSDAADITLQATYILVTSTGTLRAGSAAAPHPRRASILLAGRRDTPNWVLGEDLNLGAKVGWLGWSFGWLSWGFDWLGWGLRQGKCLGFYGGGVEAGNAGVRFQGKPWGQV